jgi:hypothetical protein
MIGNLAAIADYKVQLVENLGGTVKVRVVNHLPPMAEALSE